MAKVKENNQQNILIVKNRAMGDAIMGTSAVSYLRSLYPEAKIYYAVPSWVSPLFEHTTTDADEIIPIKLFGFKDFFHMWKILRLKRIDCIYEMHQSGRTAKFFRLYKLLHFFKVKYFFHNHHLKSGGKVHDQGVIKSVIQRDLDGVYSYLNHSGLSLPSFLDFVPRLEIFNSKKPLVYKVIIGVVATRETKMWPLENYIELMGLIKKYFTEVKKTNWEFIIPLSRSGVDQSIKEKLDKINLDNLFTIKQVSMNKLPELMSEAMLYIGNDTGLKHLAVALNIKTYTFFGPEPPNEWHPYDSSKHEYFYLDNLDCRTKNFHYCGLTKCDSMICLTEFSAKNAFLKIQKDLIDKE